MRRVEINPTTQCWEWQAGLTEKGYGNFAVDGHPHKAHRVSYEQFNGRIPDGMMVCHKCDNPVCINPTHLFAGEPLDNVRDMIAKGRAAWQRSQDTTIPF
jgi:hypothetical protein